MKTTSKNEDNLKNKDEIKKTETASKNGDNIKNKEEVNKQR